MSNKSTYWLFGILAGLLAVFFLARQPGGKSSDKLYIFPSAHTLGNEVKEAQIGTVEIRREGDDQKKEELTFYRTDKGWFLKKPHVRLQEWAVRSLIDNLLRASKDPNADMSASLGEYGLSQPATVVTLTQKGGDRQWTLNVGRSTGQGSNAMVYVATSDNPGKPLGVRRSEIDNIFRPLPEFVDVNLITASSWNAKAVKLRGAGKEIALKKEKDKWEFVAPAYGEASTEGDTSAAAGTDKPITGVKGLLDAAGDIRPSDKDIVTLDASSEDLQKYGLERDNPATLLIEATRTDDKNDLTQVLLVGKKVEPKEGAPASDPRYYARLADDHVVFEVNAKPIGRLLKVVADPNVLRDRELATVDSMKVNAIDIQNRHGLIKLRKPDDLWKVYDGDRIVTADQSTVNLLLSMLANKNQVRDFPPLGTSDADMGLDKPAAVVSLWVDGLVKEEKKEAPKEETEKKENGENTNKKDEETKEPEKKEPEKKEVEPKLKEEKPTVKLSFGKRDGENVYVRRESPTEAPLVALVPRGMLSEVVKGRLHYLDRALPQIPDGMEITKITIDRGGKTFEITRDAEKNDWILKKPKDVENRRADAAIVDRLIQAFRQRMANRLIHENPSDADLDKYGLKTPTAKITVTAVKEGKSEDFVLTLGKELEDKNGHYARQGQRPMVFVTYGDQFITDLTDRTVLKFDLDKVKSVRFIGWAKGGGKPTTLVFDREGAKKWTTKAPDYDLDSLQLEGFMQNLSNLPCTKFVSYKTGTKPEHKLTEKDRTMRIEITLEGEKDPLTLTLGQFQEKDNAYYAQSSMWPGDVFLLGQGRFERVLRKPGAFSYEAE